MANVFNEMMGGFSKTTPLISFYTIIDEDMALIKYILLHMRNPKVFDLDKIKSMSYMNLLGNIYKRKYKNPLYYLMRNEEDKEFLDRCYEEFLQDYEKDILQYGVKTEIYNLIEAFKQSGDVIPNILYYTDAQKEIIDNDSLLSVTNTYSIKEINSNILDNNLSQVYFRFISEIEHDKFKNIHEKTIYFSTTGINLVDSNDDIAENELMIKLIKRGNNINLFDMYKMDLIGRYNQDDS